MQVSARLRRAREELSMLDEQVAALAEEADEARIRSLVSETPRANREHEDARRHMEALSRGQQDLRSTIASLERAQDELLDRLSPRQS
jgi:chromosome segregation ATPase